MNETQIVSTPGVLSGQPRLVGTRIQAALIKGLLDDGFTTEQVQAFYPSVTARHVEAVRQWASTVGHTVGHSGGPDSVTPDGANRA